MTINTEILKRAVGVTRAIKDSRKVTVHSPVSLYVLRYFELSVPNFKIGIAAAGVLEETLETNHPEIWSAVCDNIPANRSDVQREMPKIEDCNVQHDYNKAWAEREVLAHKPKVISVYSARAATVLRYMLYESQENNVLFGPQFSISKTAAGLIGTKLRADYPELF